ncbi:MAG: iron ABC transporter permease [Dysgonamonadaceae bacterium]|jgi:iron complex transport system permease protein|nr:iron ABC transporter permease [Dysgonamonadaceae bacterium]
MKRSLLLLAILFIVLSATTLLSFAVGRYPIAVADILRYLFAGEQIDENIPILIEQVRTPRILGAILAGGSLSVAGAVYQGLFRNPMVSPDILGVTSGAGFGATLAILFSAGLAAIQLSAFGMGLLAVFLTLLLSRIMTNVHDKVLTMVLSGMIVGALFGALIALMKYLADSESRLPDIVFWLMGSLSEITMKEIKMVAPIILIALVPLQLVAWRLNVLSFGEGEARTLGVNTKCLRLIVIVCASLLTASVIAVSGLIGWVGLIIPHLSRFIIGPDHRLLLPASFFTGSVFLLWVDNLSRSIASLEIPLGILTSMIGAPLFFIVLKISSKRVW